MAINRFSTPANFQPESLYTPIPLDYLNNTLQAKQQQYDLGLNEQQNLIASLTKIKAREEDVPALQNINKAYESELTSITNAVNNDYGSSEWRNRFNKVKNKLSSDLSSGDLGAISQNYLNFQDWNAKVLAEKDNYNPYLDQAYERIASIKQGGGYRGYKNQDGSFNIATSGAIDKQIDRQDTADKLIKGIASDSNSDFRLSTDTKTGNSIIVNTKNEGVSPNKIAQAFRNSFGGSEAMSQIIKEANFTEQLANRQGKEFNKQAFVENKVQDLEKFVVKKYSSNNFERDIKIHNAQEWQQDANATPTYTPTKNGAAFTNPNVVQPLVEPGSSLGSIFKDSKLTGYASAKNGITDASDLQPSMDKQQTDVAKKAFNKDIEAKVARINSLGTGDKFTKQSYIEATNKAINDLKNVTLVGEQIQPKQAEVYQTLLDNSKASSLYNIAGKGNLTINQIAKEYGVDPEEIQIKPSLIHYDSVDPNQKGGSLEVTLAVKGKEFIPATTPINDNFTAETSLISEIGQNSIYKGTDTYTKDTPYELPDKGIRIYTTTIPKKNYSSGKELPFKTIVTIEDLDENGNIENTEEMSYQGFKERIGQSAKNRLLNVKNSNQSINKKD